MSELSRIIANKTLVTIIKENMWIIHYEYLYYALNVAKVLPFLFIFAIVRL